MIKRIDKVQTGQIGRFRSVWLRGFFFIFSTETNRESRTCLNIVLNALVASRMPCPQLLVVRHIRTVHKLGTRLGYGNTDDYDQ